MVDRQRRAKIAQKIGLYLPTTLACGLPRAGDATLSACLFLIGRHDVNAMSSLVKRYYNVLEAPRKELIWFEAGHGRSAENMGQFVDVMVNKVPETHSTDD